MGSWCTQTLTVLLEIANFVILERRVYVFHAAAQRIVREVNHYVVDHFRLVFQAQRLHIQNEHQHEAHRTWMTR